MPAKRQKELIRYIKFNQFYMEPTPDGVERFRKIYKEEYGRELTYEEAKETGENLLRFFKLLIEIDQGKKKDKNNEDYKF